MTQEQESPTAPPQEPILPDGIGLNLEQAKALISQATGFKLANDDPALMGITICNAYLGEVQKLHARHAVGLSKLMAEKTDAYVAGVNTAVEQLSTMLSLASVEGVRKIFDAHAATLNAFRYAVYFAAAVVATSALLNVAVFVLKGIR